MRQDKAKIIYVLRTTFNAAIFGIVEFNNVIQ